MTDTSCSTERPPNNTATVFSAIASASLLYQSVVQDGTLPLHARAYERFAQHRAPIRARGCRRRAARGATDVGTGLPSHVGNAQSIAVGHRGQEFPCRPPSAPL